MMENLKKLFNLMLQYIIAFLRWVALGGIAGVAAGTLGALFARSIEYVTELRRENFWLILLRPIGGILSVAVYNLCRVTDIGTNRVFESVRDNYYKGCYGNHPSYWIYTI